MELPELSQTQIFLLAIAVGAVWGVVYDVFRFFRIMGLHTFLHMFIQDVLFWCIASVAAFFFAVAYNNGEVRVYTVAGHICGLLVYRYTVGLFTGKLFLLLARVWKAFKCRLRKVWFKFKAFFKTFKQAFLKKSVIFYKNNEKKKKNTLQVNSSMVYNKKKYSFLSRVTKQRKGNRYG